VTNPELITAVDLEAWSESLESRAQLPHLVRRLLLANRYVREVAMRSGEGIGMPGCDGSTNAVAGDKHVPEGIACWEVGTSDPPADKAQDDYRDRTAATAEDDRLGTAFVVVTSRRWRGRDEWRARRLAEGKWRDVRAYDADTLEAWLEITPSVHIWASELLGRQPRHARTPDFHLPAWSRQTKPALSGPLLLAGRQEAAQQLVDAIGSLTPITTVVSPSAEEGIAFVCAALLRDEQANRIAISRTLVVDDPSVWDRLVDAESPLIFVPTFPEADASGAIANGHQVVVPVARRTGNEASAVVVPDLDLVAALEVLISQGIERREAERVANEARRSVHAFRRTHAVNPHWRSPSWASPPDTALLAPLSLLGQWDASHEGDRGIVAALCSKPYEELESDLLGWSTREDPPLRRTGPAWRIASREDAWLLLSLHLTSATLTAFRERAFEVLSYVPVAPTTIAEMFTPDRFSKSLRTAVAETCAFLSGVAGDHRFTDGTTGASVAATIARDVLGTVPHVDGPTWVSLHDVLPLLAEAAPDVFLDSVESDLALDVPLLRDVFPDEGALAGLLAGSTPYVGVVWALESLCWSSEHLGRAARALAKLDLVDPGGNNRPRPFSALHNALNLYLPQTSVPLDRRIVVIDGIRASYPDEAWKLLKTLLPSRYSIYDYSNQPWWRRSWVAPAPSQPSFADVVTGTPMLVTRIIDDAGSDLDRWAELVPLFENLPANERDRMISALEQIAPAGDAGS
jgi:hypothetical protein